ncbi:MULTISPECIES: SAM-dependent methyltransferase [unclassified Mycolicibacterium]|uniref:SAM-dependent methyltransferase n=1 Tax=unclassified Mycolicibacterium TaxID=2636767 RepID=UPI0012DC5224|nr:MULTISPECIES: SAM-dependent methyltransferase [unclassified Mycolicibacterium]MUL82745.1 SAM-dependent methyltransferase [Mycolicibacterium sp. CBMA 329]MUL89080.1 SAM-dependent methyltransferase [Mycolicibacterium sp. CBMA 331]MUL97647.1 SAM-dependent methyltransferase [Mycolicibacterium sp. CBMA 334]MUM28678.1 SAM-dependent methyltransferase [Mycolicibacterium sp. CBMA 295]MUM38596.1 SAM-dependent methyltransferase [Mycolicibacterium sp. CBMA 247]
MPSSCVAHPADLLDTYLLTAVESGVEQVVFLASDLDPRPYQLPWPAGTGVYVVDHPAILDVKTDAVTGITTPTAAVRGVAAAISGNWPSALTRAGFDADRPTLWSVEGVLPFIPLDEQRRLIADITALSASGSRLISEMSASPFRDDSDGDVDVDNRWRQFADADIITKWRWSFAASRYVIAYLTSERPTSEHEAVETVLDPVDHRRGGSGRRVHGDAGAHVLRRRRRFGYRQRQGR